MSDESRFATAINCMDGRTQLPVIEYLKSKYNIEYVDAITEPGPIQFLARNKEEDQVVIDSIKKRVTISVNAHGSNLIAIVGHHDCAGNPVDKSKQLRQLAKSIHRVTKWGHGVLIIGLWIDENWEVNEVEL